MDYIAATNNKHKLKEMKRILARVGGNVMGQLEAGITFEPEENGSTFAENALIKAKAIFKICGKAVIADDSGLCVDAINGAPGVHSARYCGRHGDDKANNDKLLYMLRGVPEGARTAAFVSNICIYLPDGRHFNFEGRCEGAIAFEEAGKNGFGYDPLFIPDEIGTSLTDAKPNEMQYTYAQLTDDQKDAVSHRARAFALMEQQLPKLLAESSTQFKAGSI